MTIPTLEETTIAEIEKIIVRNGGAVRGVAAILSHVQEYCFQQDQKLRGRTTVSSREEAKKFRQTADTLDRPIRTLMNKDERIETAAKLADAKAHAT
jgi:hypothetical protein